VGGGVWRGGGGPLFRAPSHYLQVRLQSLHGQRVVIEAQQINFIDYSGVEMLHQEARRLNGLGRSLALRKARQQVVEELKKLEGGDKCPIHFED